MPVTLTELALTLAIDEILDEVDRQIGLGEVVYVVRRVAEAERGRFRSG